MWRSCGFLSLHLKFFWLYICFFNNNDGKLERSEGEGFSPLCWELVIVVRNGVRTVHMINVSRAHCTISSIPLCQQLSFLPGHEHIDDDFIYFIITQSSLLHTPNTFPQKNPKTQKACLPSYRHPPPIAPTKWDPTESRLPIQECYISRSTSPSPER